MYSKIKFLLLKAFDHSKPKIFTDNKL
jgi:hypothetical protein